MHYVGLDVHARQSSLEMLDEHGKTVKRMTIKGPWPKLIEAVERLPQRPLSICYEASCGYGYLHDRFRRIAERVAVGHPGQMRLIFKSKKKNDRVDAGKIARLLYLDLVPQVHVPEVNVRQWRRLIEFRQKLVGRRALAKNQVRAILRSLAIATPRGLWSKKGQRWLAEVALDEAPALERDLLIEEINQLTQKIDRVEKELAKIADRHPAVTLLRTIPGVGIRTAEAFVAYVDDPARFARSIQFGSYFGLVPCQDSSAGVNRLGHITKDGPATVRKLLCEAAWQAIRHSPTIRRWFERISGNHPDGRKIAVVAVARKLAVVMGAMLRGGEVWQENHQPLKNAELKDGEPNTREAKQKEFIALPAAGMSRGKCDGQTKQDRAVRAARSHAVWQTDRRSGRTPALAYPPGGDRNGTPDAGSPGRCRRQQKR